jgi:hypothetical protein
VTGMRIACWRSRIQTIQFFSANALNILLALLRPVQHLTYNASAEETVYFIYAEDQETNSSHIYGNLISTCCHARAGMNSSPCFSHPECVAAAFQLRPYRRTCRTDLRLSTPLCITRIETQPKSSPALAQIRQVWLPQRSTLTMQPS